MTDTRETQLQAVRDDLMAAVDKLVSLAGALEHVVDALARAPAPAGPHRTPELGSVSRPAGGVMTDTLTLTHAQRARLQQLVYMELKDVAERLAENAHEAAETNTPGLPGVDARSYWQQVQITAELLDLIGWDVLIEKGGE